MNEFVCLDLRAALAVDAFAHAYKIIYRAKENARERTPALSS